MGGLASKMRKKAARKLRKSAVEIGPYTCPSGCGGQISAALPAPQRGEGALIAVCDNFACDQTWLASPQGERPSTAAQVRAFFAAIFAKVFGKTDEDAR
jgi:hypothetical protein